jgi:16S rRNA (guanine966-N2)-methyltransferase
LAQANQVRIIGGRHRGRRLHFAAVPGLRPTPDRVRETLFNWLQGEVHASRCLDLYAGSGALGLEALSRGAGELCAVEHNRTAAARLRENLVLLGDDARAEVVADEVMRYLDRAPAAPFDIVFADPPFADPVLADLCRRLEQGGWLADRAWIYLEQDARRAWAEPPDGWTLHREGVAGQSAYRLLRRNSAG